MFFFLRQTHIVGIKELMKQCDPNALDSKDIWPGDLSVFLPFRCISYSLLFSGEGTKYFMRQQLIFTAK